jgi:hypothetical protein
MMLKMVPLIVAAILCPKAAPAQERVALAIEGWQAQTRSDGVVAYRCASSICAAGSEVSYKRQPHRMALTLAQFEAHHRQLAAQYRGTGRIRDLRISASSERVIDGVRVLQLRRDFDWVDGSRSVLIESRLIGPKSSYSVVSASPAFEWTARNFEGFLPRMIDIAALQAPE